MPSSLRELIVPCILSVWVRMTYAVGQTHLALIECDFGCLHCLKCRLSPECRHHFLSPAGTHAIFASMDGLWKFSCFGHWLGMSPPHLCWVGPLSRWAACHVKLPSSLPPAIVPYLLAHSSSIRTTFPSRSYTSFSALHPVPTSFLCCSCSTPSPPPFTHTWSLARCLLLHCSFPLLMGVSYYPKSCI